nr:MAG TPA: hypothetical protein [Caudoviricetes sp.]
MQRAIDMVMYKTSLLLQQIVASPTKVKARR